MGAIASVFRKLMRFFRRNRIEEDLNEEIRFHLEMEVEKNLRRGYSHKESRRRALLEFGGVEKSRAECRDAWGVRLWDQFAQNLKFTGRLFLRNLSTSVLSVTVLAMGLGISIGMFAVAKAVLWSGIGSPNDDRLSYIRWSSGNANSLPQDFSFLKENVESFESIAAFDGNGGSFHVAESNQYPERYFITWASETLFETIGIEPLWGEVFSSQDSYEELSASVVISHRVWKAHFEEGDNPIGKPVFVEGKPYTVRAVMPIGFGFPSYHDIWVFKDWAQQYGTEKKFSFGRLEICGLLKEGVSRESAETELQTLSATLIQDFPDTHPAKRSYVVSGLGEMYNAANLAILATLICSWLVLVVSCINASNLIAARAFRRSSELATRSAFGASRVNVAFQVVLDSLLITSLGALIGWVFAAWASRMMQIIVGSIEKASTHYRFELDTEVALFAVGISFLAALVSSIIPAIRASSVEVNAVLKDDGRTSSSLFMGKVAKLMIGTQIAVSAAMLIVAIVAKAEVRSVLETPLNIDSEKILTSKIRLDINGSADSREIILNTYNRIKEELESLPNIDYVSYLATGGGLLKPQRGPIGPYGLEYLREEDWPQNFFMGVSRDAFKSYGVSLLAGRDFEPRDGLDSERVCIVSSGFAKEYWPDENPIGKQVERFGDTFPYRIIGVVPNILETRAKRFPSITGRRVYFNFEQDQRVRNSMELIVRGHGDTPQQIEAIRGLVSTLSPHRAMNRIQTLKEELVEDQSLNEVFAMIFTVFGIAVLFMAFTGLYAIMLFASKERAKEFGIRSALGALRFDIIRSAFRQTTFQTLVGLVLGAVLGHVISLVILDVLMEGKPDTSPLVHPSAYVTALTIVLTASFFATGIPAWKTANANPLDSLRDN